MTKLLRLAPLLLLSAPVHAEKMTAPQLIDLSRSNPAAFKTALVENLGEANIKAGTAFLGRGENFIFAVESASRPTLKVDDAAGPAMIRVKGTNLWHAAAKLRTGTSHTFEYVIDGKPSGGFRNVPALGPDSYLKPGVPTGTLSERKVHVSKIYDRMKSNYWVYVPAQYNAASPAALMVFQDGHRYTSREDDNFAILNVIDNYIHEKKIPVMILVFTQPGDISETPDSALMSEIPPARRSTATRNPATGRTPLQDGVRSSQYDKITDRYARFLRDELLPEAIGPYNVRKDGYSRAISGLSSGGICAFNAAWHQPDQFSRVLSWIGSFVPLQPEPNFGGQAYPAMVQREAKRNIRVWLQDGAEDQGTWPLMNLALANQLKARGYDFHLSYGTGTHHSAHGSAEFPQAIAWLWRDYDPAKTGQTYTQDPEEQAKPLFRVQVYNRDH